MDIAELVIKIRATAENLEQALNSASQKIQTFAKEAEKATGKPIRLNVQTEGLKQAGAEIASLGQTAQGAGQAITGQFRAGVNSIRELLQSVSTITGKTMAQARDIAMQAGAETEEQISAMIQAAQKGYMSIGEAAQVASGGAEQVAQAMEQISPAAQMAGASGLAAGTQAAAGAGAATAGTVAWTGAVKVLKTALGGVGFGLVSAVLMKGFGDLVQNLVKTREEAEKLREETIKTSRETSAEYSTTARTIREYAEEYAALRHKQRDTSEEKRFLELQSKLAEALGTTTEAIYAQSASLDAWTAAAGSAAKQAAETAARAAETTRQLSLEKAWEAMEKTKGDIYGGGLGSYGTDKAADQAVQSITTEYVNAVEAGMDVVKNTLFANGKEVNDSLHTVITNMVKTTMQSLADGAAYDLEWEKTKAYLDTQAANLEAGVKALYENLDFTNAMEGQAGLIDQVLSGGMTPEQAHARAEEYADAIYEPILAFFEGIYGEGEKATKEAGALFAILEPLGNLRLVEGGLLQGLKDVRDSADATRAAAGLAAQGMAEYGETLKKVDADLGKMTGQQKALETMKNLAKQYNEGIKAGKDMSKTQGLLEASAEAAGAKLEYQNGKIANLDASIQKAEKDMVTSAAGMVTSLENVIASLEAERLTYISTNGQTIDVNTDPAIQSINAAIKVAQFLLSLLGQLPGGSGVGTSKSGGGGGRKKTKAELAEEARRAAEEARQEAIRQDYALLDHQKHMNQLSLEAELQMLYQIRDAHELNAEQIMEWERKVYDLRQELRQRDADSLDKTGDALIEALGARYQAMQDAEIQRLDASRKAWEDWRDDSVKAIRDQIAALDELSKTEDREKQDQEELRKIAKLRQDIEFEQNKYNRMKLQQQLDQAISSREDRLRRLAVQDQKDVLNNQIQAIQDQTQAQLTALDSEQAEIEKAYAERMKTAALRAEAEKLLMTGTQQEIINLIGEFAPDYNALGKTLGEKLLEGFQSKVGGVVDWFQKLNDSLYAIQEQALAPVIAATNAFQAGYQQRQSAATAATVIPPTVVNQTVNFNEPVESAGQAARRIQQVNEELGALLYGG